MGDNLQFYGSIPSNWSHTGHPAKLRLQINNWCIVVIGLRWASSYRVGRCKSYFDRYWDITIRIQPGFVFFYINTPLFQQVQCIFIYPELLSCLPIIKIWTTPLANLGIHDSHPACNVTNKLSIDWAAHSNTNLLSIKPDKPAALLIIEVGIVTFTNFFGRSATITIEYSSDK